MRPDQLPTPCLVVDLAGLDRNIEVMGAAWPGSSLRPHVKAFKSTALAARLAGAGHRSFCCATAREVLGLAAAGLGEDLLLANESLDPDRLAAMARCGARVTVAVDSAETVAAASQAGITEVLIDVDVGLYRCGVEPDGAGPLADAARRAGLEVRGVMGYEGHLMMAPEEDKAARVAEAMALLDRAQRAVGGDVVSGGGTGTYHVNRRVTELQAGTFTLMDADYARAGLPFVQAVHLWATVISVRAGRWAVVDAGLKALGMDHGNPTAVGYPLLYCSDEHSTLLPDGNGALPALGERVRLVPAHLDPTIAYHPYLHVAEGGEVVDRWPVDLRHW